MERKMHKYSHHWRPPDNWQANFAEPERPSPPRFGAEDFNANFEDNGGAK